MELHTETRRAVLGNNIKVKRLEVGWSQAQLAKMLGVSSTNTVL